MAGTRLLAHDGDLLAEVTDPVRRRAAIETVIVDELNLGPGDQLDVSLLTPRGSLGALVASGFLCREITIAGRISADLAGPEDLLSPTHLEPSGGLFSYTVSSTALGPTRLALLDHAFCEGVLPWPEVMCALVERARRPGDRAALGRAIARAPTVEVRLLMSLWHWASSWSSVGSDGVRLTVPLSHERLARLIGAARPTVTTAIGRLRQAGYLDQRRNGQWLLLDPQNASLAPGQSAALDMAQFRAPPSLNDRAHVRSPWDLRTRKRGDVYARLAEQRELLRAAADRHVEQLVALRERSNRLRETAELSELARQARDWPDESRDDERHAV